MADTQYGTSSDSGSNGTSGTPQIFRDVITGKNVKPRRPGPSVGQVEDFTQSNPMSVAANAPASPDAVDPSSVQPPDFRSTGSTLNLPDNTPIGDAGFDKSAQDVMNTTGTMPSRDSMPSLAPQEKHPFLGAIKQFLGLQGAQPGPGEEYRGPVNAQDKSNALKNLISRGLNAVAMGAAHTPEEQEILLKQRQFPQTLAMQRSVLENEAARWRALAGEKERHDVASEGTAQQRAATGEEKVQAQIPLYGAQTDLAQAKAEKTQLDIWQMQQGMFPVDAITAQLVNRPDLEGKAVPTALWKAFQSVLNAKGLHTQDLGNDGLWLLDRYGNRVHQISATSPSVARAQAYGANRPVQVIDDQGNLRYMPAGQAYATGASPAGPGVQAGQKEAQFRDIQTGSASARQAILNLDSPLSASAIGELTMAIRETDPTVFHQLMDNFFGTQQLSEPQKDFAVTISQLNERALSLRSVAGMGQGSDQLRAAIRATLPSAKSGDRDLMLKQLNAFDQQVDALHTGVPGTAVNPKTPVHKAAPVQPSGGAKRKPNW